MVIRCSSRSNMSEEYLMGPSMSVCCIFCNNEDGGPTVAQWDPMVPTAA